MEEPPNPYPFNFIFSEFAKIVIQLKSEDDSTKLSPKTCNCFKFSSL
jgi:hypothetical protein